MFMKTEGFKCIYTVRRIESMKKGQISKISKINVFNSILYRYLWVHSNSNTSF